MTTNSFQGGGRARQIKVRGSESVREDELCKAWLRCKFINSYETDNGQQREEGKVSIQKTKGREKEKFGPKYTI